MGATNVDMRSQTEGACQLAVLDKKAGCGGCAVPSFGLEAESMRAIT